MKPNFTPLFLALLATNGCMLSASATVLDATVAEPIIASHSVTISRDESNIGNSRMADVEVMIAQVAPRHLARDVQIHAFSDKGNVIAIPEVDILISNAMSEAFSNSSLSVSSLSRNPIKNAPYTAEVISEKIRTLADGNQISSRHSSLVYRDSAGRTRQEMLDAKGDVVLININDAVEGKRFVISPLTKTATRIGVDKDLQKRIKEITEKAKAMAKDAKTPVTMQVEQNGDRVVIKRAEESGSDGKKEIREEVRVRVVRDGNAPGSHGDVRTHHSVIRDSVGNAIGESMRDSLIGNAFQDSKWSATSTVTELGTRDFDGLRAEGKRRSYTIPAGAVGNKNPITVTSETWHSPDLQVTVYSKQSDPRSGDAIFRLANVKRSEQPLALFSAPADYTLRDGQPSGLIAPKPGLSK